MTPRRPGLLSVLCSTEAFTGLTTRHGWTATQWETWTADALRQQFGNGTGALRADQAVARAQHVGPPVPSVSAADWRGPFRAATDSAR
jgi:hypothetical protein